MKLSVNEPIIFPKSRMKSNSQFTQRTRHLQAYSMIFEVVNREKKSVKYRR